MASGSEKRSRSSGGSEKRSREISWREEKMRKMGNRALKALILGKRIEDIPVEDEIPKHKFALELGVTENYSDQKSRDDDAEELRIWMKTTREKIDSLKRLSQYTINATQDEEDQFDDKSDYEYPNIADFLKLGETDMIYSIDFKRDMARYARDKKKSDGFDVGYYPYRDAARICGSGYVFRHYKPPEVNLPEADLKTLVCVSNLAFCVYNKHQVPAFMQSPNDVRVLKAMKFGNYGTDLNITFLDATFPSHEETFPKTKTFQTRVYNRNYPPHVPYSWLEIVLVRKLKEGDDDSDKDLSSQETDYLGDEWLPKFPSNMEKLSDFDENDPQADGTRYIVCADYNIAYHFCMFALHQYNIALYWRYRDQDEDDEINDSAKVISVSRALQTVNEELGTTYYFVFKASLLDNNGNPQTLETKLFMSPLIPTTKIKIKFVRIKGN